GRELHRRGPRKARPRQALPHHEPDRRQRLGRVLGKARLLPPPAAGPGRQTHALRARRPGHGPTADPNRPRFVTTILWLHACLGTGVEFEWDEAKSEANRQKHGVRFTVAVRVFSDPQELTEAAETVDGEARLLRIGEIDGSRSRSSTH